MNVRVTDDLIKQQARKLKSFLKSKDINITHGWCLDAVSDMYNFKDYNQLSASLKHDVDEEAEEHNALDSLNLDYFIKSFNLDGEPKSSIRVSHQNKRTLGNVVITGDYNDYEEIYDFIITCCDSDVFMYEGFMIGMLSMFRKAWERDVPRIVLSLETLLTFCAIGYEAIEKYECDPLKDLIAECIKLLESKSAKTEYTYKQLMVIFHFIFVNVDEDEAITFLDMCEISDDSLSTFIHLLYNQDNFDRFDYKISKI